MVIKRTQAEPIPTLPVNTADEIESLWRDDCRIRIRQLCYDDRRVRANATIAIKAKMMAQRMNGTESIASLVRANVPLDEHGEHMVDDLCARRIKVRNALGEHFGKDDMETWGEFGERIGHPRRIKNAAAVLVEVKGVITRQAWLLEQAAEKARESRTKRA